MLHIRYEFDALRDLDSLEAIVASCDGRLTLVPGDFVERYSEQQAALADRLPTSERGRAVFADSARRKAESLGPGREYALTGLEGRFVVRITERWVEVLLPDDEAELAERLRTRIGAERARLLEG